jgi:hypothetical protein
VTDLQRAQELFARTGDMRYWDLITCMYEHTVRSELRSQDSIQSNVRDHRTSKPFYSCFLPAAPKAVGWSREQQ